LNLFIAFLSPPIDPETEGPLLPQKSADEYRPFVRKLPEFKFWYATTKSTVIGMICTFFEVFNIPVFWPILVMYFITLFCITMKRQIKHMIKYKYLPFTHNKPRYQHVDNAKWQLKAQTLPSLSDVTMDTVMEPLIPASTSKSPSPTTVV